VRRFLLSRIHFIDLGTMITDLAFSGRSILTTNIVGAGVTFVDFSGKFEIMNLKRVFNVNYCCGKFGFVAGDDNKVRILDEYGNLLTSFPTNSDFARALGMNEEGVLACSFGCGFYDYDGNIQWSVSGGPYVNKNPVSVNSYWFVPELESKKLYVFKDGEEVQTYEFEKKIHSLGACGTRLAVGLSRGVVLFDATDPLNLRKIWEIKTIENVANKIAFSPNCEQLVIVSDKSKKTEHKNELRIYDMRKRIIVKAVYSHLVKAVDWKDNIIVEATHDGDVFLEIVRDSAINCWSSINFSV